MSAVQRRRRPLDPLRDLVDAAEEGLLALDESGTIVEANASVAAFLGRERRHLIGKPLAALVGLEDRRAFRLALATAAEAGTAGMEIELGDAGQRATLRLDRIHRSSPPRLTAVITTSEPRPLVRATDAPAPADSIVKLLGRFPHALVAIDGDLVIRFANQRARILLGNRETLVGMPLRATWEGHDLHALAAPLVGGAQLAAHLLELPDGRVVQVTGCGSGRDGGSAVLMLEDVTERLRSTRVMHEFLRNAAHQLRTPLTGIATSVEVLQSGAKERPADRDHFLQNIERDTLRLTRLARALLVLARAQAGVQPPRLDFVVLLPTLEELVDRARPAPSVTIDLVCAPNVAALAEPDLLREALAALIDNAVDHTLVGGIRIEVAECGERQVEVSVRDTGSGIDLERRGMLFEPFAGDGHDPNRFGLGLAIAHQAVMSMNGRLRVESTPGAGSTFALRLPSARVEG